MHNAALLCLVVSALLLLVVFLVIVQWSTTRSPPPSVVVQTSRASLPIKTKVGYVAHYQATFKEIMRLFTRKGVSVYPDIVNAMEINASPQSIQIRFRDVKRVEEIINEFVVAGQQKRPSAKTIYAVFVSIDDDKPLSAEFVQRYRNVLVFRPSLQRSLQSKLEIAMPFPLDFFVQANSKPTTFKPVRKTDKPKISFCGWYDSHVVRRQAIDVLQTIPTRIETHFILRSAFHAQGSNGVHETEFRDNMQRSEFNLCVRGLGNYAMRFYETLAAGRIPVLVDTDLVLPFADIVPWRELCVISPTVEVLPKHIETFWATHNVETVQRACYQTCKKHFRPHKLAKLLYRELVNRLELVNDTS